ncbi:MAG: hypothetical protein KF901_26170 [Myxococcales bacterium]|nr:hypothetical protein [Myxococcales bacterium]
MRWLAFGVIVVAALASSSSVEAQVAIGLDGARSDSVLRQVATRLQRAGHDVTAVQVGRATPSEVAQRTGATIVVTGRISRRGGRWRASATVFAADGREVGEVEASAPGLAGMVTQLSGRLDAALGEVSSAAPVTPLERRRVVVAEVEGPPAASGRVTRAVVSALQSRPGEVELLERSTFDGEASRQGVDLGSPSGLTQVAAETGVAAYVTGRVTRRGRTWQVELEVRDGRSGRSVGTASFSGRNPTELASQVERGAFAGLRDGLAASSAPEPPARAVGRAVSVSDPEESAIADTRVYEADAGERAYVAIDLGVYFRLFSRRLRYTDDLYGLLRTYTLPLGPSIRFDGRWYPGAHIGDGFYAHIGFDFAYELAFGIDSRRADGEVFPTSSRAWSVGMRGRVPFGAHEASLGVGYGLHSFVVEAAGPSQPGREIIPQVPGMTYRFVRLQAEGRFALIGGLRATLRAAYLVMLDTGGVQQDIWFPRASAGGVEAEVIVGYELDVGLEIRLSWDVRRYFFSMNPEVGDPFIAGGALDQYFGYTLGVAYRY